MTYVALDKLFKVIFLCWFCMLTCDIFRPIYLLLLLAFAQAENWLPVKNKGFYGLHGYNMEKEKGWQRC